MLVNNDARVFGQDDVPPMRQPYPAPARFEGGDEAGVSLRRSFGVLVKHYLLIVGFAIVAVAIALVVTLLTEPSYVARVTFEVQRSAPRVLDVNGVEAESSGTDKSFLETQFAFLNSRSLAAGVVRRLRLDRDATFLGDTETAGQDGDAAARRNIEIATSRVMNGMEAEQYGASNVIQLAYSSDNPVLAARIANAATDEFIESNIQRQYMASSYAREFVGKRLAELKQRLEASERELVGYAEQNRILAVTDAGTGGGGAQSLDSAAMASVNERLSAAQAERIAAEQRWQLARTRGSTLPEIRDNPRLAELQSRLATLQADYQQKRQTFKPTYPVMVQLEAQIELTRGQIDALTGQIVAGTRAAYDLAVQQEQALQGALDQMKTSVLDLQNRSIQYTILQREVQTNRALYDALLQRYKEIGVAGGAGSNNITVVDRARVPGSPESPVLWLNVLLALIGGIALGVGAAFVIEFIDDTIKTPDDVERKLHLPLLGVTPAVPDGDINAEMADRRSVVAEAYYAIQTSLQMAMADGMPRSLLVTSSGMGEGKSTTSAALALGLANYGKRVLLVDADLRRPTLHRRYDKPNQTGLSRILTGEVPVESAIIHLEDQGFDIITSGPLPPSPAQLLSTGMAMHFDRLLANYDLVILDGPPVLGLADAPLLADTAGSTLLVIESRRTRRASVRNALRRLGDARGILIGVVLTKFDRRDAGYGYGYEYNSYYSYGRQS